MAQAARWTIHQKTKTTTREDPIKEKINEKIKNLTDITCKDIYWQLCNAQYTRPTAIGKWEELYYFADFDWKHIFWLPFLVARETTLHSLQYQIIRRYIPCWTTLNTGYREYTDKCIFCQEQDALNILLYCAKTKDFSETVLFSGGHSWKAVN